MPIDQPSLRSFISEHNAAWGGASSALARKVDGKVALSVKALGNRSGVLLQRPSAHHPQNDLLATGDFFKMELGKGLVLQCSDTEESAYSVAARQPAGLSCIFLLHGELDITIGPRRASIDAGKSRGEIKVISALKAGSVDFKKRVARPQRLRKLVLHASPQWLSEHGASFTGDLLGPGDKEAISFHSGRATPRQCQLIREILKPGLHSAMLLPLFLESRVIEVLVESLATMYSRKSRPPPQTLLNERDRGRMFRAREFIANCSSGALPVERIAREAGISVSGLQVLFRRVEGCSVKTYARRLRLDRALRALQAGQLNVQQASVLAGYKSPENFATAFKREFGITPRQAVGR